MIGSVIRTSLRFRLLVVAVAAAVMAVGVVQLRGAPADVLPEFTPPYAEIQTEALGLSAEEVEQLITVPLEADLLNGVEGVSVIRSQSVPGVSSIVLVFEPGTDVYRARQLVEERLTQAHALPNVSKPPALLQPLSSSSRVLMIGLSSKQLSPIEQSVIARWTMSPRLMGVPGVANVAVWGMRDRQLQVQVDPERLRQRGVTLNQVVRAAGNAQVVSPLSFLEASTPGTGGFIESPQQRLQVRNVLERIADPDQLGNVALTGAPGKLRLGDVADVKVGHQPLIGDAVVDGGSGLFLVVEKFPGASTMEVTEGVEDALDTLSPGLAGLRTDTSVLRPANYIEDAIANIGLALLIGGALLALALAALLFRWRAVLVSLVTIPLALLAAALVLDLLGETFNAISFAGLAAAVAVVVDDAVVGVAGIERRLRLRRQEAVPTSAAATVLDGSKAVRRPLAYATLIVLLAIVPVVVMEGRPGAFFGPLALAYALAVAAAMVVALTVTPALSLLLLSRVAPRGDDSPVVARAARRYGAALAGALRRPRTVLLGAAACALLTLVALPLLGTSPVPSFKDRDVLVHLDGEPGTSNTQMTRVATAVGRDLRAIPGVEHVGAHVGRAVTGDQVVNVNSGELWVSLAEGADHGATMAAIERVVGRVPRVRGDVVTAATQSIRDVGGLERGENRVRGNGLDVLTGADEPLVVRLFGQDSEVLRREADRVRRLVEGVDGVVGSRVELPRAQPTLEVEVDLAKAERYGIKPGDVRRAEATLLQGIQVGSVFQGQKIFDVLVQGVPGTRQSVGAVRDLLIDRPGGGHVRLGQVADVRVVRSPAIIERDAVSRRVDVVADVSGRGTDAVAGDIERRLSRVDFPLEYHAEVLRRTTADEIDAVRVLAFGAAAVIAAFLLLQAAFRSWRLAGLVLLTVPASLAGGVVVALIDGAELTLGALTGLLVLLGLAVRAGLLSVCHLQALERDEGHDFGRALVDHGARERLGPILTTAVALAGLALPFAVLGSRPGLEVLHPMALVLLGGLVTTTAVSLFVLPALYLRFGSGTGSAAGLAPEEELMYRWAGIDPAAPVPAPGAVTEPQVPAADRRPARPTAPATDAPRGTAG